MRSNVRAQAEAELRRLLFVSQQQLTAALERPMLPAHNDGQPVPEPPKKVRWWARIWSTR